MADKAKKQSNIGKIQNKSATMQVLGCLLNDPTLLLESSYSLAIDDFPEKFHAMLFSTIHNLFSSGIKKLDTPTIVGYLREFPNLNLVYEKNNGSEYIEAVKEIAEFSNFDTNYKTLKKFSILRDLYKNGLDISDFFDPMEVDPMEIETMQEKIHKTVAGDIINHFILKVNDVATKFDMENQSIEKGRACDVVEDIMESFKKSPDFGAKMYNQWFNTAFRGAREGKFYLETSSSGGGKSRRQIREAVHMSVPFLYDTKQKQWLETGVVPQKTTYICTELEPNEIIPIAIAFLTGINEEKIKMNTLTEEEAEVVSQAIRLMKKYPNFFYVTVSDFDTSDIEKIITEKILREGCKYFFFDYIHSTSKSLSYYGKTTGVRLQEHQILFLMAVSLKAMCQKYRIFLYSSTQTNSGGMSGEVADEQALRGSKAIAD